MSWRSLVVAFAGIAFAICVVLLGDVSGRAASVPLSISIVGNHFVDGVGRTIRLLGVNHTSSEYGCVDGFGHDDGHFNDGDTAAIASWGANAVRIPLNEDCWLGINGQPNSSEGAKPPLTSHGYQQKIESYVADLQRARDLRDPRSALDCARQPGRFRAAADARPGSLPGVLVVGCLDVQEQTGGRVRPVQRALRSDRSEVRRRPEPERQDQLELALRVPTAQDAPPAGPRENRRQGHVDQDAERVEEGGDKR